MRSARLVLAAAVAGAAALAGSASAEPTAPPVVQCAAQMAQGLALYDPIILPNPVGAVGGYAGFVVRFVDCTV